ncbi:MAG: 7-cyano-7-deazaguanine synthase QueC [Zymomonas mobilis]|uniref:7-cyano-7-deazaguanine synthase n=1 Tax=Zymomonas mobilis TaxID=542 RepID=A0A542W1J3_ZYMMB|nr:7-cyano-7-deazaguanine synthase QueC [Zymomonas mobilis]TQL17423.1 preQ(0) biosynthesis protein QueC [Zymomonas mobilis]
MTAANQTKESSQILTSDLLQERNKEGCLVLYSGGQDSATCLAWALEHFEKVETIGFDYGQRHKVELECREGLKRKFIEIFPDWAGRLGEDHMLDLAVLHQVSECALTRETEIAFGEDGIPNSFVPGRNLLFFTFAATIAYRRGLRHIVGGMCETDYSGYPDCRDDTIKALQVAINLGLERRLVLHTPLMWLDKAATWRMAENIGGEKLVEAIRQESHSCYLGERKTLHPWGYGCGHCPACELRASGWESYQKGLLR